MGPGKSEQWALDENFDSLCADLTRHMTNRGVTVLPIDHWIDAYDHDADNEHVHANTHNMVQMTLQFTHAVTFRNQCAILQSLPSQPYPFRDPLIIQASDRQGFEVATELRRALHLRFHQVQAWERSDVLDTLAKQAFHEMHNTHG